MRLLSFLLSLSLAFPAVAQLRRFDHKDVDRVMASAMKAWRVPGAAVVIVRNDQVIYAAGYGAVADGSTDPVTPETLFGLASTSKAFTSTAMAMLVSDGKVDWDDPVRKHLPSFRLNDLCADSQVTVRDILSHRTGLTRHDELWDNTSLTAEEVVRAAGRLELDKPFRSGYQYQNIMYIAAGELISNRAGMPWQKYMRERIFKPLGMIGTIATDDEQTRAPLAMGHSWDGDSGVVSVQKPSKTAIGSAGSLRSSARDLGNWLRFQLADGSFDGTQLLDPAALGETKSAHTAIRVETQTRDSNPETNVMSYGLGWVLQDYRGELLVSHAGALNGFRAHVDLLPRRKTGFAVLLNLGRGYAALALRNSLADLLTGKNSRDWNAYYLMVENKVAEQGRREAAERDAKRIAGTTPTQPLERYAGRYRDEAYGDALVSVDNGRLVLSWQRVRVPLEHYHYDVFTATSKSDDIDEQVVFQVDETKQPTAFTMFGQRFQRVP